jgi:ubiquinone/menaquinone biosynthesis C-methylase UbiE
MAKTDPFDQHLSEYEQWFKVHNFVFLSEVEAIRNVLSTGGRGVEIGVGSGIFAAALGIKEGCDPSGNMRAKAIERGIDAVYGIAEELPYADASIDFVLVVTTICFVDNAFKTFREINRVLKTGGEVILGFVDRESPVGKLYHLGKDKSTFYKDAVFFSTGEIYSFLKDSGFTVEQTCRTLFGILDDVTELQPFENGCDKGSSERPFNR